ncbi:putative FixW protein [Giardia muris]|uniref:FixW protein, putative n=1 Tax=Giardia muris TaxID=5742 RepID=A0A3Q8H4V2_GIAMU|nr:FixW protein, putative [Giardia muris]TNJ28054.1 putative FixW protein [Giardia muris]|eukprot:TNJ28054.1 putative FixW protein [Giardia muris]
MSLPNIRTLEYVNQPRPYKEGMPIMIEAFATWCPPCRGMIPHMAELSNKYQNVYIVSVSQEEKSTVEAMAGKIPPMKEYNVAVDPAKEVAALMDATKTTGIPAAFLFDKEGKLVWSGHPSDNQCDAELQKLNA